MSIQYAGVRHTLDFFADFELIPVEDSMRMQWLFGSDFTFRAQLDVADSLHVHIKVADAGALPDDAIVNAGGRPENRQPGYVKYVFPARINVIFSSIPVAEEDRLPDAQRVIRPALDHVGLDLRAETTAVRQRFDAVSGLAALNGWRSVSQGGGSRAVFCCHTQVNEKRWAYPPYSLATWRRPLEFAFGPLIVSTTSMGCDLRPMDPAYAQARGASECCVGSQCAPQSVIAPQGSLDAGRATGSMQAACCAKTAID